MKKLLFTVALAALGLFATSLSASAQGTPQMRGSISAGAR